MGFFRDLTAPEPDGLLHFSNMPITLHHPIDMGRNSPHSHSNTGRSGRSTNRRKAPM